VPDNPFVARSYQRVGQNEVRSASADERARFARSRADMVIP